MKYPDIDPVIVHLGPLQVRWYGLMYVVGFIVAYLLILKICSRRDYDMDRDEVDDLFFYSILGLILGARIGYCLIYNFTFYLNNPLKIFAVWEGGMSFHGGLIGVLAAGVFFARKRNKPFLMLADLGAAAAPPGLFFGRIGNFINGELYGRITDLPWGMVFPGAGPFPRHPSQLYEAFFEGIVLFLITYSASMRNRTHGTVLALFLFFYGIMRFFIEFCRQPDAQIGFLFFGVTMGQLLCLLMAAFGLGLLLNRLKSLNN